MKEVQTNTPNITITKRRLGSLLVAIVAIWLVPAPVAAHGGEEHVIGTVAKVSDTAVTVRTAAGKSIDVGFDAKTTYARAAKPVAKSDIKIGDRIVIHAVEVDEKLVAHTVELGAATATTKKSSSVKTNSVKTN